MSTKVDPASAKITARAGAFGMRHSYINGVSVHALPLSDVIAVADAFEIAINTDRRGDLTHINTQLVRWYDALPLPTAVDTKIAVPVSALKSPLVLRWAPSSAASSEALLSDTEEGVEKGEEGEEEEAGYVIAPSAASANRN